MSEVVPSRGGADDELVDVVDDADRVVGTVSRSEMRRCRLRHRAVFVAVLSSTLPRRVLVHRRAGHKDIWPDRWDMAVGGVVGTGESYPAAAARETGEELGIGSPRLSWLGSGCYADGEVDLVGHCFLLEHDGPFTFADGEIAAATWVDAAGLRVMLDGDVPFVPDSVALVLPLIEPLLS